MNTHLRYLAAIIPLSILAPSCASLAQRQLTAQSIALAYYQQDREYESLSLSGVGAMTITAAPGQSITFTTKAPLESLPAYPQRPDALGTVVNGIVKVGGIVGAAVVGSEFINAVSDPTVVMQPAPVIVGP